MKGSSRNFDKIFHGFQDALSPRFPVEGGILLPRDFLRQTAASHDPPTCAINMPCEWQQWDHRFEDCVTSRWNLLQTWPEFFASIMQITTASHVRQPHFCDNAIFKELGHSGKHMKDYDMDDHTFSFNSAASCWKTRLFAAIGWSLWQSKQWSSNCMMTMNYGLTQPMANL